MTPRERAAFRMAATYHAFRKAEQIVDARVLAEFRRDRPHPDHPERAPIGLNQLMRKAAPLGELVNADMLSWYKEFSGDKPQLKRAPANSSISGYTADAIHNLVQHLIVNNDEHCAAVQRWTNVVKRLEPGFLQEQDLLLQEKWALSTALDHPSFARFKPRVQQILATSYQGIGDAEAAAAESTGPTRSQKKNKRKQLKKQAKKQAATEPAAAAAAAAASGPPSGAQKKKNKKKAEAMATDKELEMFQATQALAAAAIEKENLNVAELNARYAAAEDAREAARAAFEAAWEADSAFH